MADLVGHFYDAALDDDLWNGLAERIAQTLDCTSTVLKFHGADGQVSLLEVTPNMIVADHLQDWAAHWHSRDLWVERTVAHGLNRIVTDDDLIPEELRRKSGYYQEWLRHLEIYHVIGGVFPVGTRALAVLGVHRPQGARPFDDEDRRKVEFLLPHLQRALNLGQHVAQTSLAREVSLEALDAVDTGVMILDSDCYIHHANAVAEAMLARSNEFVVRDGQLIARDPDLRSRMNVAVDAALSVADGGFRRAEGAIRIDRPERASWTLAVSPLRHRWSRLVWQKPLALMLMRDPEYPPFASDLLRALFGMTRMEANVAAQLAHGASPAEIGTALGIGPGTVRTHMKQILSKTGTRRQAEAAALISRTVAVRNGS